MVYRGTHRFPRNTFQSRAAQGADWYIADHSLSTEQSRKNLSLSGVACRFDGQSASQQTSRNNRNKLIPSSYNRFVVLPRRSSIPRVSRAQKRHDPRRIRGQEACSQMFEMKRCSIHVIGIVDPERAAAANHQGSSALDLPEFARVADGKFNIRSKSRFPNRYSLIV